MTQKNDAVTGMPGFMSAHSAPLVFLLVQMSLTVPAIGVERHGQAPQPGCG